MRDLMNVKYIIVGDSTAGKSCLLLQFTDRRFHESTATIGVEFGTRIVSIRDKRVKIQAWDTAGQEKFRSITRSFFRNTACALVVYDITTRSTFENVTGWLEDCKSNSSNSNLVIMIIGNKLDLEDKRRVSSKEGKELADKFGAFFWETSAKTGHNVDAAFLQPVQHICRNMDNNVITEDEISRSNSGITIERMKDNLAHSNSAGCC